MQVTLLQQKIMFILSLHLGGYQFASKFTQVCNLAAKKGQGEGLNVCTYRRITRGMNIGLSRLKQFVAENRETSTQTMSEIVMHVCCFSNIIQL